MDIHENRYDKVKNKTNLSRKKCLNKKSKIKKL
jgi:hypothetical protein